MLRKLIVNKRSVPVPVPLKTLGQVFQWIRDTLVSSGHTITKIELNGQEVEYTDALAGHSISDTDLLDIRIDSPADLGIQSLEAIANLAAVVMRGLRPLAVKAWELSGPKEPEHLAALHEDVELIYQIMEHFSGLVLHKDLDTRMFARMQSDAHVLVKGLSMARANGDWRGYARILLNRVEPFLHDLTSEAESLESRLLTMRAEGRFAQAL